MSCKTPTPKEKTSKFDLSDSWLLKKVSFVDPDDNKNGNSRFTIS